MKDANKVLKDDNKVLDAALMECLTELPVVPEPGAWTPEVDVSWYGKPFHGRETACGDTYNQWGLTAAHRTLPCGTVVWMERNGRIVRVRINDRFGPTAPANRIYDVSRRVAEIFDMLKSGVFPVRVAVVEGS